MTTTILTETNLPTDLIGYNFVLVLADLDPMIGESICQNSDGTYTIFINSRWSSEMQRRCVLHAFDHIRHNDWEKEDVQQIEGERHDTSRDLLSGIDRPTSERRR
jgi:hypothetical protein